MYLHKLSLINKTMKYIHKLFFLTVCCLTNLINIDGKPLFKKNKFLINTTYKVELFNDCSTSSKEDSVVAFRIVVGDSFSGAVFPKEIVVDFPFPPSPNRYTLKNNEVSLAESILCENIKVLNRVLSERRGPDVIKHKPYLSYKKLKKYFRQYVGYKTKNGDILIRINFIKKPLDQLKSLDNEIWLDYFVHPMGAETSYSIFNIVVNLNSKEISLPPSNINVL